MIQTQYANIKVLHNDNGREYSSKNTSANHLSENGIILQTTFGHSLEQNGVALAEQIKCHLVGFLVIPLISLYFLLNTETINRAMFWLCLIKP